MPTATTVGGTLSPTRSIRSPSQRCGRGVDGVDKAQEKNKFKPGCIDLDRRGQGENRKHLPPTPVRKGRGADEAVPAAEHEQGRLPAGGAVAQYEGRQPRRRRSRRRRPRGRPVVRAANSPQSRRRCVSSGKAGPAAMGGPLISGFGLGAVWCRRGSSPSASTTHAPGNRSVVSVRASGSGCRSRFGCGGPPTCGTPRNRGL